MDHLDPTVYQKNIEERGMRSSTWTIGALVTSLICAGCDVVEERHPDYNSAVDLRTRGWMPSFVPRSAQTIVARYDADTNAELMMFELSPSDFDQMIRSCSSTGVEQISLPRRSLTHSLAGRGPRIRWWPKALSNGTKPLPSDYTYHKCIADDGGFLAITQDKKRAFYWH